MNGICFLWWNFTRKGCRNVVWSSCFFLLLKRRIWNSCCLFPLLSFMQTWFATSLAGDQRFAWECFGAGMDQTSHFNLEGISEGRCRRTGMCLAWDSSRACASEKCHMCLSTLRNAKREEGKHLKLSKREAEILTGRKLFWKTWKGNAPSGVLLLLVPC